MLRKCFGKRIALFVCFMKLLHLPCDLNGGIAAGFVGISSASLLTGGTNAGL